MYFVTTHLWCRHWIGTCRQEQLDISWCEHGWRGLPELTLCLIFVLSIMAPPSLPLTPPLQTTSNDLVFILRICLSLQSVLQSSTNPATQLSLSPISPSLPPQPPLSGLATPWTCWEPIPPPYDEPIAPPAALEWGKITLFNFIIVIIDYLLYSISSLFIITYWLRQQLHFFCVFSFIHSAYLKYT